MTTQDAMEPPWWTPRKSTARRSLDRGAIVAAARTVLRDEGIDALSMRRVATELGTGPASLYAHVANKDELLELLLDEVIGEVPVPEPDPARWREQVVGLWVDSRDTLSANGDIARVALGRIPMGPHALRVAEVTMTLLRLGGVPDRAVAWAVDVVGLFVSAHAVEGAVNARAVRSGRDPAEYYAQVAAHIAALPPDVYPTTVALAPLLTTGDGDERFRFGLDLLINGLAALAPAPPAG